MPWGDGSGVPTTGQHLVIVGLDTNGLLHIRTFDAAGVRSDTFETTGAGALHLVSADASGKVLGHAGVEPERSPGRRDRGPQAAAPGLTAPACPQQCRGGSGPRPGDINPRIPRSPPRAARQRAETNAVMSLDQIVYMMNGWEAVTKYSTEAANRDKAIAQTEDLMNYLMSVQYQLPTINGQPVRSALGTADQCGFRLADGGSNHRRSRRLLP